MSRNIPEDLTPRIRKHKTTRKKDVKNYKIKFIHPACKFNGVITNEFVTTSEEKAIKQWLREWPGLMKCDIIQIDIVSLEYEPKKKPQEEPF